MLDIRILEARDERNRYQFALAVFRSLATVRDRRFQVGQIMTFLDASRDALVSMEERYKSSALVAEVSENACHVLSGIYPRFDQAYSRCLAAVQELSLEEINEVYCTDSGLVDRCTRMDLEWAVRRARAHALFIRQFTDLDLYQFVQARIVEALADYFTSRGKSPPSELLIRLAYESRKALEASRSKGLAARHAKPTKEHLDLIQHALDRVKEKALEDVDASAVHPAFLERRVSVAIEQTNHIVRDTVHHILSAEEAMYKAIRALSFEDIQMMPQLLLGKPEDFPLG